MRRVAKRQVVVTWDPEYFAKNFWLIRDYLPQVGERERTLPTLEVVVESLVGAQVSVLPVPADCMDGVLGAYWRRPEAYLSAQLRGAMSGLALSDQQMVTRAIMRLEDDLDSGHWHQQNQALLECDEFDLGISFGILVLNRRHLRSKGREVFDGIVGRVTGVR